MAKISLDAGERNAVVSVITNAVAPAVAPWLRETWRGAEHVPATGGAVIAANHLSYSDPFVIGRFLLYGAGRLPHFLGKAEVFAAPVLGPLLRRAGQIPVHRGTARAKDSFVEAVDAVAAGRLVCLLPEGTLTRDRAFWPMTGKSGAARIALTTGAPLVTVAMWGPERIIPPTSRARHVVPHLLTRRHDVTVVAGEPVDLDDLRGRDLDTEVLTEATRRLMAAILELLCEIRGERPGAPPLDNPRTVSRPTDARGTR